LILELPLSSDPSQVLTTVLNGVEYDLAVKWGDIARKWTLDLTRAADQVVLATGLSLVLGVNILGFRGLDDIGMMMLVATSDPDDDPTDADDDLGGRVKLYFMTPEERP
jgi:hypothetical protein